MNLNEKPLLLEFRGAGENNLIVDCGMRIAEYKNDFRKVGDSKLKIIASAINRCVLRRFHLFCHSGLDPEPSLLSGFSLSWE
jgi:hypothetical protein